MTATGWHGGPSDKYSAAGYGIRISRSDRDTHFDENWESVTLELEGAGEVRVTVSDSFWSGCTELRLAQIGRWMLDRGLAPWPKGDPPKFDLEPIGEATFRLRPRK